MKYIKFLGLLFLVLTGFSCKKVLDRYPLDSITDKQLTYSKIESELYVNQFYSSFPGFKGAYSFGESQGYYFTVNGLDYGGIFWADDASDNMIHGEVTNSPQISGTAVVPPQSKSAEGANSGWDWTAIRNVNYFLANNHLSKEPALIKTYVGEAYFFRAYFYYGMLKRFGALPWFNKPLQTNSEELYAARLPRNVIADSILADLDKAIGLLDAKTPMRVNRDVALAFKSRVALYEGTWEKYHVGTEFAGEAGVDPNKYFRQAANASELMITEGHYAIPIGNDPRYNYWRLFNQTDFSANHEMIMWRKYDLSVALYHVGQSFMAQGSGNRGVSKLLVDYYLCSDGKPITGNSLYQGDNTLADVVKNRDPRLAQTIATPGVPLTIRQNPSGPPDTINKFTRPLLSSLNAIRNTSGYQLYKGVDPDYTQQDGAGESTTAGIIFRYGEVLLNYAEAKAELGEADQAVLDKSINQLRDRIGMIHLTVAIGFTDPNWDFPSLSPLLNEIRRERRIELACEGFRFDDLMRWRAHHLIKRQIKGAKFAQFVPLFPPNSLNGINVSTDGYIFPYKNSVAANGWQFDPGKNYLMPLPADQLTINKNMKQNPGY